MAAPKDTAGKVFRRKESDARHLTSERIAEDMKAFGKAGGRIEVLGVTRVLTRVEAAEAASTAPARPAPGARKRGPG